MKPFLKEIAEKIYKSHPKLEEVTLVLPNRRAALFIRKYLSEFLTKPAFAPQLLTIEDFISSFSPLKVADKLELIFRLYQSYNTITRNAEYAEGNQEPFDQFYFWGDMLLRDFEEVDRYMVNAEHLFKDLSHQKELDASFDFLTEEQKTFLKNFWNSFEENETANKKRFLNVWRQLPKVYEEFKQLLTRENLAYEGMLHRNVATDLTAGKLNDVFQTYKNRKLAFIGFNAFTAAEEKIILYCIENANAEVYWDIDEYYVNNIRQEAGRFFRIYQQHPVFGKTFPADIPANLSKKKSDSTSQKIQLIGAAQPVGQAKIMSQLLQEQLQNGFKPEETLIVLPDEKLLLPVLHGVAGSVDTLNVTMGFALSATPLFTLIELLTDLQITRKKDHFNHRQVLAVLGHPYVVAADSVSSNNKRKEILKHNWVSIPKGFLATEVPLHRLIFVEFESQHEKEVSSQLLQYLKSIVTAIGTLNGISDLDKEYAYHFLKLFNRLETIFTGGKEGQAQQEHNERSPNKKIQSSLKAFLRLFRQLVRAVKIPFSGEPLRGLQVMGVLETRNLDFKNVFVLSLNEGSLPAISSKGSYIPFNIRKAYGLPTAEHQDSIYAYLFYRILQRAENIFLFYNSETDVLGQGEMSRYLQQLIYESGLPIDKKVLHNSIQPQGINPIVVDKNAAVMEDLMKINEGNAYFQGISPSALNTYIECRLKFYFRHVAKIKEADEVEEEFDARVLGNFLHDVMERFYKRIRKVKQSNLVDKSDFDDYEKIIEKFIDEVFIEQYRLDPGKEVVYEGQSLVVREIVKRFAFRIIEMDKSYAPFQIEGLEQGGLTYSLKIDQPPYKAVLSGKIDRVDSKEHILRVIDYKTGKDKLNFDSIESLFARDGKRNKAAFQTLLYALLYKKNFMQHGRLASMRLIPGLINRLNLFDEEFSFGLKAGKDQITDVDPLLPEFEERLKGVFNELFDPEKPFDQTGEFENCRLCAYGKLCYR
ncbi:PD-(D/E)XK nuclease family protein [Chryseosolibacter indicus]|uniref:PD-(D/E)XK nuclease family protein n=1 Tax=Chryseosolibacter indicus TaxID=2782351 RepID=A0ABS5VSF3_9BACT|nr:PD-(D/E)XK nuclease family protein [Chryseosolibacter indicus]MBT1704126.1 PD-(D/E)XK nuclease family protein [Chryseosolibacter indicus]